MSSHIRKAFTCLTIVLLLSGVVGVAFGWDYYPTSYNWDFQNFSSLSFNPAVNFTDVPHQGVPYDNSLVGYWGFDEGSGSVAYDSSGNGNNGTLMNSPQWTNGKYGNALSFSPTEYVQMPNAISLNPNYISISAWVNLSSTGNYQSILDKITYSGGTAGYFLFVNSAGLLLFEIQTSVSFYTLFSSSPISWGQWTHVVATYDGSHINLYINGVSAVSPYAATGTMLNSATPLYIGAYEGSSYPCDGIIDDVRIYNRALSANEIAALYDQSDRLSYANYYYFSDSVTNNTLVVNVIGLNATINNTVLVTCTNFFVGNMLAFQANNSATVNVWTNLGQPAFTTGLWNSENYTTTLTLDASSTAELNWSARARTSSFPIETAVIATVAIAVIIAGFAFAFKKGYITIEVVDEENPQETQDDYTI